ncbi:MAG TPA: carbon-nitrogen hydrolase family protein [Anaerolineae bacterium]
MSDVITVAAAQFDPHLGDAAYNTARMLGLLADAARIGAALVVFPECAVTGYNFASVEEAHAVSEPVDGPSITALQKSCRQLKLHAIVGTLRPGAAGAVYNTAALIGPAGLIGVYDKAHLPFCGADKFNARGDTGFRVFDTPLGRIGMLICYDLRFPEAARLLALRGADIIALPTNWPTGADSAPEYMVRARAFENRVFVVACNRTGEERGARYIGQSCIAGPDGRRLADASAQGEEIITAVINVADARHKRLIVTPGEFEMDFINDRRPDLYS